jgi:hypothetical protein
MHQTRFHHDFASPRKFVLDRTGVGRGGNSRSASSVWDVIEVMARDLNSFYIIREATLEGRSGHDH